MFHQNCTSGLPRCNRCDCLTHAARLRTFGMSRGAGVRGAGVPQSIPLAFQSDYGRFGLGMLQSTTPRIAPAPWVMLERFTRLAWG